ncbi:hypothetical protein DVA76_20165, partial [Acinetobacter baumannii]
MAKGSEWSRLRCILVQHGSTGWIPAESQSGFTHVQRRFWDLRGPPEPEGAVALETGILVATLHHLVAAP